MGDGTGEISMQLSTMEKVKELWRSQRTTKKRRSQYREISTLNNEVKISTQIKYNGKGEETVEISTQFK
jgi:hypothetical protein